MSAERFNDRQGDPVLGMGDEGRVDGVGGYEYPGSWGGGEAPPMATSTLTGRNPAPMMTDPQGDTPTPV